ncbi:GID complex subunit containing RING finger motif [Tulasnella sp. 424]|nr:GID complex subunit containing RING finger motif [Tulasnella sp. 424]KAG8974971.1 GID complex subunit containing RING finger motif [Tulasnella sp. 425]
MDVCKVNHEAALMLEQPLIKVPYEQFRRNFKASQKAIERDYQALQKESADASKNKRSSDQALKALDGMINRVEGLKRKLEDIQKNDNIPVQASMRRRLDHISTFESFTSTEQPGFAAWADTRLDRWLVDWSLRNGKEDTAKTIASSRGIEDLVEINSFSSIRRVEAALRGHSCTEALAWCSQNKVALAKTKTTLEFDLRLQEFIELARSRKTSEAMAYSRKHFTSYLESHAKEVTHCMGLLACGPDTPLARYKRLYDPSRWETLVNSFRTVAFNLYSLPTEPLLHLALYAGLASLKLPACSDGDCTNIDCPTCDSKGLGQLAKSVPMSHHVNSTIVCRISGDIMDENNPPMAFPNGFVYSTNGLKEMASRNDGQVTCPRSGFSCDFKMLRKVYIT